MLLCQKVGAEQDPSSPARREHAAREKPIPLRAARQDGRTDGREDPSSRSRSLSWPCETGRGLAFLTSRFWRNLLILCPCRGLPWCPPVPATLIAGCSTAPAFQLADLSDQ